MRLREPRGNNVDVREQTGRGFNYLRKKNIVKGACGG